MLFPERRFSVADLATVEELAEKLTQHSWTLCQGFSLRDPRRPLLFLNDSTSDDGAREFAVVEPLTFLPSQEFTVAEFLELITSLVLGRQIESITFGWCTQEEALRHIENLVAGGGVDMHHVALHLDSPKRHTCGHCQ